MKPTQAVRTSTILKSPEINTSYRVWNIYTPVYEFGPSGTTFNKDQKLEIYYDHEKFPFIESEDQLGILVNKDGKCWWPVETEVDLENHKVTTDVTDFSLFTIHST